MSPQEKVDWFFSSMPVAEAGRLLDFFKELNSANVASRVKDKKLIKTNGPDPTKEKQNILRAIGK